MFPTCETLYWYVTSVVLNIYGTDYHLNFKTLFYKMSLCSTSICKFWRAVLRIYGDNSEYSNYFLRGMVQKPLYQLVYG